MSEQNFSNHTRFVMPFHFFVLPVFVANLIWSILRLFRTELSFGGVMYFLIAAALVVMALYARLFALSVQDRVIRLEERLRYERLLPGELKGRIDEFSVDQMVALRFASDGEVADLARRVLEGQLKSRKAIKQQVRNWKADHLRA